MPVHNNAKLRKRVKIAAYETRELSREASRRKNLSPFSEERGAEDETGSSALSELFFYASSLFSHELDDFV